MYDLDKILASLSKVLNGTVPTPIVLVLGPKKSGKTTFIARMLDQRIDKKENSICPTFLVDNKSVQETQCAQIIPTTQNDFLYCDCPGFPDQYTTDEDKLMGKLSMNLAVNNSSKISSIILLVQLGLLRNKVLFKEMSNELCNILDMTDKKYFGSTIIVITDVEDGVPDLKNGLKEMISDVSAGNFDNAKKVGEMIIAIVDGDRFFVGKSIIDINATIILNKVNELKTEENYKNIFKIKDVKFNEFVKGKIDIANSLWKELDRPDNQNRDKIIKDHLGDGTINDFIKDIDKILRIYDACNTIFCDDTKTKLSIFKQINENFKQLLNPKQPIDRNRTNTTSYSTASIISDNIQAPETLLLNDEKSDKKIKQANSATQHIPCNNRLHDAAINDDKKLEKLLGGSAHATTNDEQLMIEIRQFNSDGFLPIHLAVQRRAIKSLLILCNLNIEIQKTQKDHSIFHLAVMYEQVEILVWLLEKYHRLHDIDDKTNEGKTALDLAVEHRRKEAVKLLLFSCFAQAHPNKKEFDKNEKDEIGSYISIRQEYQKKLNNNAEIENLVFAGGGVKGLAYLAALKEWDNNWDKAEDNKLKKDIIRIAGTSAGSITAALLSVGWTLNELERIFSSFSFAQFQDEVKPGLLGDFKAFTQEKLSTDTPRILKNLMTALDEQKSIFKGDVFQKWITDHIRMKTTKDKDITFLELAKLHMEDPKQYKLLYVIATGLDTKRERLFSHETTPNVKVVESVRASMSIPIIFSPYTVSSDSSALEPERYKNRYVDGGMVNNCPLEIFDYKRYITGGNSWEKEINKKTLGFLTATLEETKAFQGQNERNVVANESGFEYIYKLVTFYTGHEYVRKFNDNHNRQRCIFIDTNVSFVDFELSEKSRAELLTNGAQAVKRYKNMYQKK